MEFLCSILARYGIIALVTISVTTVFEKDEEKLIKDDKEYSDMNTADDRKIEVNALMTPHGDWAEMLLPAPRVIALLGQLILISTETSTDFSLEEKAPKDGYKYLKYPNSFRTSLLQIAIIGWESFNLAHKNMDQIRLYTRNMDTMHIKPLVELLMRGTDDEVEDLVGYTLNDIQQIADTCITLSSDVEKKFIYFMTVTAELLEASTNAKGVHEDNFRDTKIMIDVAKTEEKHAREEKTTLDKEYNKINEDIEKAQQEVQEALKSTPSDFKLIGLGLLDTLVGVLESLYIPTFGLRRDVEYYFEDMPDDSDKDRSKKSVYNSAGEIYKHIDTLVLISTSGKGIGLKTPDWKNIDKVRVVKASLDLLVKNIEREPYSNISQEAMEICKDGIRISEDLIQMSKNFQVPDEDNLKMLIDKAEDLHKTTKEFLKKAADYLNHTFSKPKGPRMSMRKGKSTFVQNELDRYRIKIDVTTSVLKNTRKRQESAKKERRAHNERIKTTLNKLSQLDLKEIDFDEIREMLVNGLKVMRKEREQWGKIIIFFQTMSNTVKIDFSRSIRKFVKYAEVGRQQKLDRDYIQDVTRDLVHDQANQASRMAYFIHSLSSMYVEISRKHLMRQIAIIGGLVALDPKTDQQLIKTEQNELQDECEKATKEIESIATRKENEYDDYMKKRIVQMQEIKPLISAAPPKQTKRNEEEKSPYEKVKT